MTGIKLCVAGATGRMGSTVIKEAVDKNFEIVGAVAAPEEESIGRTLRELGICNSEVRITGADTLEKSLKNAEIYMSFTLPGAEVVNLPKVAGLGIRILMGTTGFNEEQRKVAENSVRGRVPAFFSPNFSLGINILFKIIERCKLFPSGYDFSIVEIHHTGKADAPSGTAEKLGEIVSDMRNYTSKVYGRKGISKRKGEELEVLSIRGGGTPGIHDLIIAGQHEMIRIEHTAFSRNALAQGALHAAEWLYKQKEPRIYTMDDLLQ